MFDPIFKNLRSVPNLLIITIPTIVLGCYAILNMFMFFSWINLIFFFLGYFIINIVGVTAGLHRYFSHKSFKVKKWKEIVLLFASTLSGQGSPIWWVALHRGYHHRKSDTITDPHSPIHGFFHSLILWMFKIKPNAIQYRYAVDMLRNKQVVWVSTNYTGIWISMNGLFLLISWEFFLYFSMMGSLATLLTYSLTNCLNHNASIGSYRTFQTKDNSTNIPWLFPIVLGECWHNNHHARPGSSHFGSKISKKWWEFDPAGKFIDVFKDS